MQAIYSAAFMDQGDTLCNNMLHHQVPMIHKCQAYVESVSFRPLLNVLVLEPVMVAALPASRSMETNA